MTDRSVDVRYLAYKILMESEQGTSYGSTLVRRAQDRCTSLDHAQRSFLRRLCEGVLGDRARLDGILGWLYRTPRTRVEPEIRTILRMGVYQILYMDGVPDSAACNESVRLTGKIHRERLTGFVNGVLRSCVRQKEEIFSRVRASGIPEIRYSLPAWIYDLWRKQYGTSRAKHLAAAFDEIRPVYLRVDDRADLEELEARWKNAGLNAVQSGLLPNAFRLPEGVDPAGVPGFAEGLCTVQDVSSMLVSESAALRGGERVVDVCAAPGGKALACASRLARAAKGGDVRAFDLYPAKCERIRENTARMHLQKIMTTDVRDAEAAVPPQDQSSADVLLCDLPCSGLGIIARKREIRYRVKPEDLPSLASLQRSILRNAVSYLKPGGTLIYSTCTIDRMENDEIAEFIHRELGMQPRSLREILPETVIGSLYGSAGHLLQLYPDIHGTDGFFIASFTAPVSRRQHCEQP